MEGAVAWAQIVGAYVSIPLLFIVGYHVFKCDGRSTKLHKRIDEVEADCNKIRTDVSDVKATTARVEGYLAGRAAGLRLRGDEE